MGLKQELHDYADKVYVTQWTTRDGQKVPEADDLAAGNDAVTLSGTVLYADLAESTSLVKSESSMSLLRSTRLTSTAPVGSFERTEGP